MRQMAMKNNKDLRLLLHPYIFVLREGKKINKNFLDYSLLMLHVNCPEKIKSPDPEQHKPVLLLKDSDRLKSAAPRESGS
jgi:hypothetical protein